MVVVMGERRLRRRREQKRDTDRHQADNETRQSDGHMISIQGLGSNGQPAPEVKRH
jgi:hypothetical protein